MPKYEKNPDGTYGYANDAWDWITSKLGVFTPNQVKAKNSLDSNTWGDFFGNNGGTLGNYRDYLFDNMNKSDFYKNASELSINLKDTDGAKYLNTIKGLYSDRANLIPSYNFASSNTEGTIFDTISGMQGGTFGGAYAALGAYNLMKLDDGMSDYAKNSANDPLTKENLTPFVTTGDSGFSNPLVAEYGAIANYGKVQAEKDEVIVLPDGSIVDSASTSWHKKMGKNVTTDYLPNGAVVFSNKVMVKKATFEGKPFDVVSATISNYTENEKPDLPVEYKVSDLFGNKKEMSSAELIKKIRDKFPIKDPIDNGIEPPKLSALDQKTNALNKAARLPYIAAIFEKVFSKMNKKMKSDEPQKAELGLTDLLSLTQPMGSVLGSIGSEIFNAKNYYENAKILNKWAERSNANLNMGTSIGLASTLAQDPYVIKKNYDIQRNYLNDIPDRVPYYIEDAAYNQLSADANQQSKSLFANTPYYNRAAAAGAAYDTNLLKAKSNLALNFANQNTTLATNKLNTKLGYEDRWAAEEQARKNKIIQNVNAIIANLGDQGVNYFNQKNSLLSGYVNARVGLNNAYSATTANNFSTAMQGLTGAAAKVQPMITSDTNTPENRVIPPIEPITTIPYIPNNTSWNLQPPKISYRNQPDNSPTNPTPYNPNYTSWVIQGSNLVEIDAAGNIIQSIPIN